MFLQNIMNKIVALLELTNGSVTTDNNTKDTLYYYWSNSNDFPKFPIYNTDGSLEKTIELLQKYYDEGFRIFLGFSRSNIVSGVLPWFLEHPDAVGISLSSSSESLSIKKPIYRLQATDVFMIEFVSLLAFQIVKARGRIFYFFSDGEEATAEAYQLLVNNFSEQQIIKYPVPPDGSNLTQEQVKTFLETNNLALNDVIVTYFFVNEQRQQYFSIFDENYSFLNKQYDITGSNIPVIPEDKVNYFRNYNILLVDNIVTSQLWNQAQDYLGSKFSINALNALYLMDNLQKEQDLKKVYSYNSILEFNKNNDILYPALTIYFIPGNRTTYYPYAKVNNDPIYSDYVVFKNQLVS